MTRLLLLTEVGDTRLGDGRKSWGRPILVSTANICGAVSGIYKDANGEDQRGSRIKLFESLDSRDDFVVVVAESLVNIATLANEDWGFMQRIAALNQEAG